MTRGYDYTLGSLRLFYGYRILCSRGAVAIHCLASRRLLRLFADEILSVLPTGA